MYSVRHYKGDDKIKSFIIDLVRPAKEGEERIPRNHRGMCTRSGGWTERRVEMDREEEEG